MDMFTESEIQSKSRELTNLGQKCADCLNKEQDLNRKISDRRKDLSGYGSDPQRAQSITRDIAQYERELAEVTKRHESYERERSRIAKDLDNLRHRVNEAHYWEEKKQREKEAEAKRREAKAQANESLFFSYFAEEQKQAPQKPRKKRGVLKTLLYLIIGLALLGIVSSFLNSREQKTPDEPAAQPSAGTETDSMTMIDYMGWTVADIEKTFGTEYTVEWLSSGGYWMVFPDDSQCPFLFLYQDAEQSLNEEEPKPSDQICGVICNDSGIAVIGNAKLGMDHQAFESEIGQSYTTEPDLESENMRQIGLIDLEIKGTTKVKHAEYKLIIYEVNEVVVEAALCKND